MHRKIDLTEDKKLRIAELYQEGKLSVGSIAEIMGVSLRTVHNYKNYNQSEENRPTDQVFNESEKPNQNIQNQIEDNLQETDSELHQNIELKCPECGAPESEWATIDHALDVGYGLPEGHTVDEFTHMCSKCNTLIKFR